MIYASQKNSNIKKTFAEFSDNALLSFCWSQLQWARNVQDQTFALACIKNLFFFLLLIFLFIILEKKFFFAQWPSPKTLLADHSSHLRRYCSDKHPRMWTMHSRKHSPTPWAHWMNLDGRRVRHLYKKNVNLFFYF